MKNNKIDILDIKQIRDDTEFWMNDLSRTRAVRERVESRLEDAENKVLFIATEELKHPTGTIHFERLELLEILDAHETHVIKLLEEQGNKLTSITNVDDEELDYDDMMELEKRRKNGK